MLFNNASAIPALIAKGKNSHISIIDEELFEEIKRLAGWNMKVRRSLQDKAVVALKQAVKEVVERHKKTGRPLSVWKDGKVMRVSPNKH